MAAASDTMRAVRIAEHGGPEVLEPTEVPVPAPQPGEVLVQVTAVALNNTDLWTREGSYGRPGDPEALSGWRGPVGFPRIQGADVAGRVVAVGPGVDAGLTGRRVVVDPAIYDAEGPDANPVGLMGSERDGGYAEYVTAPAERVHDVTESPLTDEQLATLPTAYGTALGMIERVEAAEGRDGPGLRSIRRCRPRPGATRPRPGREGAGHQQRLQDRPGARSRLHTKSSTAQAASLWPSSCARPPRRASTSHSTSSPGTW